MDRKVKDKGARRVAVAGFPVLGTTKRFFGMVSLISRCEKVASSGAKMKSRARGVRRLSAIGGSAFCRHRLQPIKG
jgi:hypothetical protein